jgi:hypothetical protein
MVLNPATSPRPTAWWSSTSTNAKSTTPEQVTVDFPP